MPLSVGKVFVPLSVGEEPAYARVDWKPARVHVI